MNKRADVANTEQQFGLSQFLTVLIVCAAVLAAAVLWNRSRPMSSIQIDGWHTVAKPYRDSVMQALRYALNRGEINSLRDAEARVQTFPFVESATARKIGSTLQVAITERLPCALVRTPENQMMWIDANGAVIPYKAYYQNVSVPLVTSPRSQLTSSVLPVLKVLQHYPQLDAVCSEVTVEQQTMRLWLSPYQCSVLLRPDRDVERTVERLAWLLSTPWMQNTRTIDLRWNHQIVLSSRSATTAESLL
jgi:cell division septal protein FtsQ